MGTKNKLKNLLTQTPTGVVLLTSWLQTQGYSLDLLKRYRTSQWLVSIGRGALIRFGDKVDYLGALYALQVQAGLSVHVGAGQALALLGRGQYLNMSSGRVVLFGQATERLPTWFYQHNWNEAIVYQSTSVFPLSGGITDIAVKSFSVKVSAPARAMMECLYLVREQQDLIECYQLMENLNNLRPNLVQELLEKCASVKVKRLFLYLAEKWAMSGFIILISKG